MKYTSDSKCVVAFNSTTVIVLAADDTMFTINLSFNFQQSKWTENKPPPTGSKDMKFLSCAMYWTKNHEGWISSCFKMLISEVVQIKFFFSLFSFALWNRKSILKDNLAFVVYLV